MLPYQRSLARLLDVARGWWPGPEWIYQHQSNRQSRKYLLLQSSNQRLWLLGPGGPSVWMWQRYSLILSPIIPPYFKARGWVRKSPQGGLEPTLRASWRVTTSCSGNTHILPLSEYPDWILFAFNGRTETWISLSHSKSSLHSHFHVVALLRSTTRSSLWRRGDLTYYFIALSYLKKNSPLY